MKFSNFFLIIETHLGHPYDSWTTVKYVQYNEYILYSYVEVQDFEVISSVVDYLRLRFWLRGFNDIAYSKKFKLPTRKSSRNRNRIRNSISITMWGPRWISKVVDKIGK